LCKHRNNHSGGVRRTPTEGVRQIRIDRQHRHWLSYTPTTAQGAPRTKNTRWCKVPEHTVIIAA